MKRIYYIIADTTLISTDPQQMNFYSTNPLNDIAGALIGIARRNKSKVEDLRLYICPDKKNFDRMKADYLERTTKTK